jgi:hypothetical protein
LLNDLHSWPLHCSNSQNTYPLFIACIQLIWLWPLWQTISGFSNWAFRAVWKQGE